MRDLAHRYIEVCALDVNRERRDLWRRHNALQPTRPLIYVRAYAWQELPECRREVVDPFLARYEEWFRSMLYRATLDDDTVFEPWVVMSAVTIMPEGGPWGLAHRWVSSDTQRGAKRWEPPIQNESDAARLAAPRHCIDEQATSERHARLTDAIGDIIPVTVDRSPAYRSWNGDISTQLAFLRGIEQMMLDMVDRPDWLHGILSFMRDGILQTHEEAEVAGDWTLCAHENQALPYAQELPDPSPDGSPVTRDKLWYFCASQETTGVGPAMFEEFMLRYQIPVMAPFGLSAYGCCEDLTRKIDVLRRIPNLRRIAVAPVANVPECAEQIGTDYVISYRPNPSEMVSNGFDQDHVRRVLTRDLSACRGCHVDITLKDIETVEGDPERVPRWVKIVREVIDAVWE